jgi:hypothetical protein
MVRLHGQGLHPQGLGLELLQHHLPDLLSLYLHIDVVLVTSHF